MEGLLYLSRQETRQSSPLLLILLNVILGIIAIAISEKLEMKGIEIVNKIPPFTKKEKLATQNFPKNLHKICRPNK